MPIWADARDFLTRLNEAAVAPVNNSNEWLEVCRKWKREYPAVLPRHWEENGKNGKCICVYSISEQPIAGKIV